MITGEYIKSAISRRLKEAYPAAKVYKERVKQNISVPCFFVNQIQSSYKPGLNIRGWQTYDMSISYHLDDLAAKKREEYEAVALDMQEQLLYIDTQLGDGTFWKLQGTQVKHEIVDEVLHFFITYKIKTKKIVEPPGKVQNLEIDIKLKEEKI